MHIEISDLTSQIGGAVTGVMSDFKTVFAFAIALYLAFWIIEEIIGMAILKEEKKDVETVAD